MFLASPVNLLTVLDVPTLSISRKMIQSNSSYREYRVSEGVEFSRDRLPMGPALFVVFWTVIARMGCRARPACCNSATLSSRGA
jgi:hypothetical protein